ncbi:Nudix hydrolase 1 [Fonsecaea pedrosoi]|nr:Nudix hydrolase 1 [Fonsecaea pedrosoi]
MPEAITVMTLTYGKKARMGTMGIVANGDKVLLIQNIKTDGPYETWAFPGGGVDEDETPEKAVVRHIQEEVGLKVAIKHIGDETVWGETDDYLKDDQWRRFFFVLEQVDPEQEPKIMKPHKHIGLMWMDWDELWDNIDSELADDWEETERMRFFPSMWNMFHKYPKRWDPASLEKRLN